MTNQRRIKRVHEGQYVAEIEVTLTGFGEAWGPYVDNADVQRMDALRRALQRDDLKAASELGRVFLLTPVPAA